MTCPDTYFAVPSRGCEADRRGGMSRPGGPHRSHGALEMPNPRSSSSLCPVLLIFLLFAFIMSKNLFTKWTTMTSETGSSVGRPTWLSTSVSQNLKSVSSALKFRTTPTILDAQPSGSRLLAALLDTDRRLR